MKVHLLLPFLFGILNAFALMDKHEEESMESSNQAPKFSKTSAQNYRLKPSLANRIVRGEEAEEHGYPWMASFRYKGFHFCGGSLIKPTYVLTAGHCLWQFGEKNSTRYWRLIPNVRVVLGDHYVNITEPQEQIFSLANYIHLNEEKNRSGLPFSNDLAVAKLNGTAIINQFVSLICLPIPPIAVFPGDELTISGWGMPKYPTYDVRPIASNVLKVTQVKLIKNEDCANHFYAYDKNGNLISYGQKAGEDIFCTVEEKGQGAVLPGDSGSPVMYIDPKTGNHVQLGIVSYRTGRISEEGHANVTYFLKVIEQMMTDMDKY